MSSEGIVFTNRCRKAEQECQERARQYEEITSLIESLRTTINRWANGPEAS